MLQEIHKFTDSHKKSVFQDEHPIQWYGQLWQSLVVNGYGWNVRKTTVTFQLTCT